MEGREERKGREEEARRGLEQVCTLIVDSGFKVHVALGPGLLESAYEHCLWRELTLRGLAVERQVPLVIEYEGARDINAYRLDLVVERQVILELKSTPSLTDLHRAQLHTYLRLSGHQTGFLINFNVILFKDGVRRLNR